MKLIYAALVSLSLVAPAAAEEHKNDTYLDGLNEFAEGMRKLLEGFASDLEPMMEDLAERLDGLRGYHPPEVLPNGDIIIRKKTPEEIEQEASEPEDGIEL